MPNQFALRGEIPGAHHLRAAKNNSGGSLPAKRFVVGNEAGVTLPTAVTDVIYGLNRMTVDDQRMTDIQQFGKGIATVGAAGVTANTRLTVEPGTGKVVDWAPAAGANAAIVGVSLEAGAADEDIEIEVGPPGAIGQGA